MHKAEVLFVKITSFDYFCTMMKPKLRFVWLMLVMAAMSTALSGCDDNHYYYEEPVPGPGWFAGRAYAALAQPGSYNYQWIIDFEYDGSFTVSPCDIDGYSIPGMEVYSGIYNVDYDRGRIYLSYYGYSMNSMWNFQWWDEYDDLTGTYPYLEIYSSAGRGPLDNLTFYPTFP